MEVVTLKLRRRLGKKGSLAIMEVVNIIIIVLIFATLVNLIIISTQYLHLSKIGNEVARTIAVQSGLRTSTPANYPGGSKGYYTTSEMFDYLSKNLEASHFEDYYLIINGTKMTPTKSITFDYKDPIEIELAAEYKWIALDAFIPGLSNREQFIVVNKTVYAEYLN
jgi:hypothetical protein